MEKERVEEEEASPDEELAEEAEVQEASIPLAHRVAEGEKEGT